MEKLAIYLALHGAAALGVSILGGLFLYRAIKRRRHEAGWHLLHAAGSARGIMLIALAAIIDIPNLPLWQLSTLVWLIIFFVWTSILAMILVGISGERGFGFYGSNINKLIFIFYVAGAIAVFPALLLLIFGLLNAL